ncbi:uncharacterized protein Z520_05963 [Fonsecaea multimorphosa CBS 102226]|uniref:Heterokaryon incompatibility domain-containing protein n=1 Tax=Fonsecaea multimorphosa CBS 102226 TaxID=1442371 RepID=A0A0D2JYP4_9EURO|nr:uncharacterized protein Z520_05963 [Fonsecaea multimorphosa CBS 102226]KIX98662.1 hypothetical protein Z520_05963 [Fonsecaea multimorphosa CBS 102226]OAL24848.1 hypothetical protein AYO22_05637 [Fonsecaea multimorphosa]
MSKISGFWDQVDPDTSALPHQLCPPCKKYCSTSKLLQTLPQDYATWEQEQKDGRPLTLRSQDQESYQIHEYSELRRCVSEGQCHLCAIIWAELQSEAGYDPLAELRRLEHEGVTLTGVLKGGGKLFINHRLLTFRIGEKESNTAMQLLMSAEPHTAPIKQEVDAQLAFSTDSDATLSLAGKWLRDCIEQDSACGSERQSAVYDRTLPARLIRVDGECPGSQSAHVVDTNGLSSDTAYLTLSHSWGDGKFLKLLSTDTTRLYSTIPVDELSRTHNDALSITRRLGYRYLWIDSLCIIQDSDDDWRSQSAQMASIYGNSTCNIAAENPSGSGGCFVRRNPLMQRPCQLTHSNDLDPAEGVYAHRYHTANWSAFPEYYCSPSTLLTRAWVQQERILSPRVLYFGGPEIHWECCSFQASEAWPNGSPNADDHGFDEVYPLKAAFESLITPFTSWGRDDVNEFVYELWHNGVFRQYTAADLTFEKDRLVALAGIAGVIQRRTGMTYVAGLWKEFLPMDLMWRKMDVPVPGQKRLDPLPWKAPSWSWASVKGRKRFDLGALQKPEDDNVLYCSRVLECVVEPLDVAQPILGEVSGGTITLTGFLAPLIRPSPSDTAEGDRSEQSRKPKDITLDIDLPSSTELFYFCLMKTRDYETTSTNRGLVLAKAVAEKGEEPNSAKYTGRYVRVGVFMSSHKSGMSSIFEGVDEASITLC